MDTFDVDVYVASQPLPIPKPFDALFGGAMRAIQTGDMLPVFLTLLCAIGALILLQSRLPFRLWRLSSFALIAVLSILMSLKLSEGWDELFMNLRHSYVLRDTGHFSYNVRTVAEGTVDFLPFFIVGLLGKVSLPLVESIIVLMLLGNVILIATSWHLAMRLTQQPMASMWFAAGVAMFPCVVFVGATGFGAVLFSSLILLGIYLLLFAEPRAEWTGLAVLSLLTLVRVEGAAFAALMWACLYLVLPARQLLDGRTRRAQSVKAFTRGLVVIAPFVLSAVIRKIVFGYALPNPVTFKNTAMSLPYFLGGMWQLILLTHLFRLHAMFALAVVPFVYCYRHQLLDLRIVSALVTTFLFCAIYFIGGGDWFPFTWNRYLMPVTLLTVLTFWCVCQVFFSRLSHHRIAVRSVLPAALVACVFLSPGGVFGMLRADLSASSYRWRRIDALGVFGRFLKATTPEHTVIASSEVATTMFFAERDLLDLLGVASPEVAHAPLQPLFPYDLTSRRRLPGLIDSQRPGIVCFFEMSKLESLDIASRTDTQIRKEILERFTLFQFSQVYRGLTPMDLAYYRAGPLTHLEDLGYHYVILSTPASVFYYLVHDSIYDSHRKLIAEKFGARRLGGAQIPYPIDPDLRRRFPS